MSAAKILETDFANKKVILRADLDLPAQAGVDSPNENDQRLKVTAETTKFLLDKGASVIIIGHKGRPNGKIDNSLSLSETAKTVAKILDKEINFVYDIAGVEAHESASKLSNGQVMMLENLRFDSREEANDEAFAKSLSELGDFYVNEAFASSHRNHASIVALPQQFKSKNMDSVALGLRFEKEIENLSKVFGDPKRPLLFIISGLKEDKLNYAKSFESIADKILIGGKIPLLLGDRALESVRTQTGKMIVGNLVMDKEDITLNTIEVFEKEVAKAGTVVVSGPLGKFEDEGHRQGTDRIFNAVVASSAYKVAGGGDTEAAIQSLSPSISLSSFDWVSVGGGAMLEFLSKHTLPGIEALR